MFSSIGRLTDGMGMFEMPLSYSRLFKSFFFDLSGTKLFRSIYTHVSVISGTYSILLVL